MRLFPSWFSTRKEKARKILETLNLESSTAVDLGSGDGVYSSCLVDQGFQLVVSIDRNLSQIRALQKNLKMTQEIYPILADFHFLPLKKKSFGTCFLAFSLHEVHQEEHSRVIERAADLLKQDGVFIVIDYQSSAWTPWVPDNRRYSLNWILKCFEEAEMVIEKVIDQNRFFAVVASSKSD